MKKFLAEFKEFITKGNVVDMAVAVIIGGAFGKIVTSLVNDIVMPLIAWLMGGLNVTDWKYVIKPAVMENGVEVEAETAILYGNFIQMILEFLIIAFCIFMMLKVILALKTKFQKKEEEIEEEAAPAETTDDILKDIRELLKAQNAEEAKETANADK